MILLVDSGSTKADWIAITLTRQILFSTQTLGLNPEVLTPTDIISRIDTNLDLSQHKNKINQLYFYGAGCGTERMKQSLSQIFQNYFCNAQIFVQEDTYAAVFATTAPQEKAIVSILGTGSNCSYFDGYQLHQKVQSLGYIAMDDCSGNCFGRHMIRAYYFNKMPQHLAQEFANTYNLDPDVIKDNLYKQPNANAYLATFATFLIKHKDEPFCKTYIYKEIELFVQNYIQQYENYQQVPAHFIGSIAFHLKQELQEVLERHEIIIGKVLRRPIDGLINFHAPVL